MPPTPDPRLEIYGRPQRLVKIGRRRRLNIHVTGQGAPTVILASGAGDCTLHWCLVQPRLSRDHRVVSFDRAGMGFSDPGPLPRTASNIVGDLRAALKATGLGPPYVLVGASMASFEMRLFAYRHADEVKGMVLVDPRGDRLVERCNAATPNAVWIDRWTQRLFRRNAALAAGHPAPGSPEFQALVPDADPALPDSVNAALCANLLRPSYWRTGMSEGTNLDTRSADELAAAKRPLDIPLIVLTAVNDAPMWGLPAADSAAVKAAWATSHEELARISTRGVRRAVPDTGHMIQLQRPRVVVEAVREVIAAAGAG